MLGHKPGDDFYLATYDDALGYFKKLAASSNRIKLVKVGKTTQGRDWYMAFISTPENLAQLEHYKDMSRRLALARGISDAAGAAAWRTISSRSFTSTADCMRAKSPTRSTPFSSATTWWRAKSRSTKRIRENLIVELWFSINPDGQNMVANWYRQNRRNAVRSEPAAGAVAGICGPR